ncbi:MAG: gamma-glutamyltransferase [Planctomycetes bacterium]|nr:gamma-glutamyltransferase [Planctomycetota bacterium]
MKRIISTIVSVTWCSAPLLAGGVASSATAGPEWIATGRHGMVASDSAEASRAGLEILEAGGNAIDAATAVSFALAVTRPYSTGLGGGGFLIARFADGRLVALDFRETAPAAATADMYVRAESLRKTRASRNGHLAVAVPGLVAGRCQALAQYGTLPLGRVLRAAIRLATNGFAIDAHFVKSSGAALSEYETDPKLLDRCGYVYRVHLNNGRLHTVGHTLRQPALARLLEGVAREGGDFFYRGPVAQSIQREMQRGGGIITAKDLAEYQPLAREPVVGSYREFKVISMPPPSSGGVALLQALNVLEAFDMRGLFSADRPLATHYTVEAMKHAFADRARWFGDADFVHVPVGLLTSKAYAKILSARLSPTGIAHWEQYGVRQLPDDAGTSHFCVVDKWGNAVVSTETINTSFGSLAAVEEWGLILNNQMDDFAARPGEANAFGLVQSERNAVAPKKRPLSSMSPTIVLKDDRPFLLLGASGGPRIISSVLNVMLNVLDAGMTLEEAVAAPRMHHQWQPNEVYFDMAPLRTRVTALEARGHVVSQRRRGGVIQAILRVGDKWVGASDPRKGGRPAGY